MLEALTLCKRGEGYVTGQNDHLVGSERHCLDFGGISTGVMDKYVSIEGWIL